MAKGAAAVIDIGSSLLTCDIAQAGREGLSELDYLEFPINLGYESFTHGRVSFQTLEEIARVLDGFIASARQYGVEDDAIAVTATTALREASNAAYILDQIRIKSGSLVQVLEDGQEMALIFKEVMRRMDATGEDLLKPFMMAYIGTGSVGIAAVRDGAGVAQALADAGRIRRPHAAVLSHSGGIFRRADRRVARPDAGLPAGALRCLRQGDRAHRPTDPYRRGWRHADHRPPGLERPV